MITSFKQRKLRRIAGSPWSWQKSLYSSSNRVGTAIGHSRERGRFRCLYLLAPTYWAFGGGVADVWSDCSAFLTQESRC